MLVLMGAQFRKVEKLQKELQNGGKPRMFSRFVVNILKYFFKLAIESKL